MLSNHRLARSVYATLALTCLVALSFIVISSSANSEDKPAKKVPMLSRPELLKLFASEFMAITPGEGKFPATFRMGSDRFDNEKPSRSAVLV